EAGEREHGRSSVPSDQGGQHHLAVLVPVGGGGVGGGRVGGGRVGGGAVGQHRDYRDEQPRGGQRGQRRLLAPPPDLIRGQGRGHARVSGAVVIAELLSAIVHMATPPT